VYTNRRIIHPQLLALPSSFPNIFTYPVPTHSISTFSGLSSNPTTVQTRFKEVMADARKLALSEEREELYNSIAEISEHYVEEDDLGEL
jgi:hypothetical protein